MQQTKINKEKQTCFNILQFQQKETDTVNNFQFPLFFFKKDPVM